MKSREPRHNSYKKYFSRMAVAIKIHYKETCFFLMDVLEVRLGHYLMLQKS